MNTLFFFLLQVVLMVPKGAARNTATTPVPQNGEWWMSRHEAFNERDKLAVQAQLSMGTDENRADLLYIGDSIVHRFENVGREVWDHYYKPRHGFNLGINGDRTQHVLWRLDNGNIAGLSPKLAIVMIGQNNGDSNTAVEIYEGVSAIVNMLLEKLPRTKILLLGIFQRRQYPTPERKILAECNELLAREFRNHDKVTFMDIDRVFVQHDGSILASDMPDFEHPSLVGYLKWAEAIEDVVSKLFGDTRKEKMAMSDAIIAESGQPGGVHMTSNSVNAQSPLEIAPVDSKHEHSRFHHWGIVTIFFVVGVVFYFGVYMILADSNIENKKILTNHLIFKSDGKSPKSPRNSKHSNGGSGDAYNDEDKLISSTTTVRSAENRNKG